MEATLCPGGARQFAPTTVPWIASFLGKKTLIVTIDKNALLS
jgi:hypothetical protein